MGLVSRTNGEVTMAAPISSGLIGRADIEFCHPVVGEQVHRGPRKYRPSLIKDATALSDGQRLSGALLNHEDGNSLRRQLDHQVEYLLDQRWCQSCSGLIEYDQVRLPQ